METLSTTLSPLKRERASIRLSNAQVRTSGGEELPLTGRQSNRVRKARASSKSVVLRFAEGSGLLSRLAVEALRFISKAALLVSRVTASLATGAVTAIGSLGVNKLLGEAVYLLKG